MPLAECFVNEFIEEISSTKSSFSQWPTWGYFKMSQVAQPKKACLILALSNEAAVGCHRFINTIIKTA